MHCTLLHMQQQKGQQYTTCFGGSGVRSNHAQMGAAGVACSWRKLVACIITNTWKGGIPGQVVGRAAVGGWLERWR